MKDNLSFVYIVTNKRYGTLYTGSTTNLPKRVWEHKEKLADGFTKKHGCSILVYYEIHLDINEAARKERNLKKWLRDWKIQIIEKSNPHWFDMYDDLIKKWND